MNAPQTTFREFLLSQSNQHKLDKDLVFLLEDITTSYRIISDQIRGGAIAGRLGAT